jgi:hypothetical protein
MNRRTIFFVLTLLLVLLTIPSVTNAVQSAKPTVSVQDVSTKVTGSTDAGELLTSTKKSEYVLPYPGILPDHPLYFLKTVRDRIIELLVVDPARRAEFYLLQSDKWLSATQVLLEKGKKDLAQTLLNNSSVRLALAIDQLTSLKGNGKPVPTGTIDRFKNAIQKHIEVLTDFEARNVIDVAQAKTSLNTSLEALDKLK